MRKLALAASLVVLSAPAFAQDVKTDFDKNANFAAIKTFAVKIGTSWNNQISEKRVTDEITQTLTEKGWKQVDANPDALGAQSKKGVVCVRSSRVATGRVGRNVEVDDDKLGLVASDDLNPQKARVLLRLALLKSRSMADMQRLFAEY